MTEHYTKSTLGVTRWCGTCGRTTLHAVSGKRVGHCTEHEHPGLTRAQEKRRKEQVEREQNPRLL